ncbi:MAG: M3 family metallopeptidase [Myxococcales bacterium]|nr:M3 family metallopeptidase [Myxococcales bacterium]
MVLKNPLLDACVLPRFDRIEPVHVEPALRELLAALSSELSAVEREAAPTWQALVEPLERIGDRLDRTWGVVGHLMAVRNSEELRRAYERIQPEVVNFSVRLAQSRPIYDGLKRLKASAAFDELDAAQQRIVQLLLRDAELTGVGLEGAARERFNRIQTELAELATRFSNHVLDATKAFALSLRDRGEVDGLPASLRELSAQAAREAGESGASAATGPWRITLDAPSFVPFMEHCRRRDLRERLYRAFITRACNGSLDNGPLIECILRLRREQASLLGFSSYAELSLASKMAEDVPAVDRLLEELRGASFAAAEGELDELRQFAEAEGAPEAGELQHWDVPFWAERLREKRYAYREEELRPYFPLPRVLEGLFGLAQRLFGVQITPADGEAPVWHEDVRFFRVREQNRGEIAAFYLDPYSRPAEKRGGAWMDECRGRSRLLAEPGRPLRLPVAYLICNQTPPIDGKPSLLTFAEVETLFHEFGHALQHMLTRVDYGLASGIRNVEWDAVELASQFMENWCYDLDTLIGLSSHFETGAPLPQELFTKIRAARTYRAGSRMLRQLFFSFLDLELHHHPGSDNVFETESRVAQRNTVLRPLPEDRFLCSFEHIFAGGYAAGYYSYKWAEVLSADAFAAFEEAGLEDESAVRATGSRFRETVLALGGSAPAMEVFRSFRGCAPSTRALLRHTGLAQPRTARSG